MPILHFTVIFDLILHFTASELCCFHFTGLLIFPVLQPKFDHFTLYIFLKALFTALRFTYCPPTLSKRQASEYHGHFLPRLQATL